MNDHSETYDNLVVGGGISGLGLAHWCAQNGLRTLVVEATDALGGCIHSYPFPGTDGFWAEMGSHTCYNSYGNLLGILSDLQLTPTLLPKAKVRFRVLDPDGALGSVFSRLHPAELALSLPRLLTAKKSGKTVAEYYGQVLGARNYRDLFGPAFNAVICQPAGEFPADMLFRRKPRDKTAPRSFTLAAGLGEIPAAIAAQSGLHTLYGVAVSRIRRAEGAFRVDTDDGRELKARRLSLAVGPDVAARLLQDAFPDLARPLAQVAVADIDSVAVAIASDSLPIPPLAGIIAPRDSFYAAVSRDYLVHPRYRGLTFHFRPDGRDEAAQLRRICEILGIAAGDVAAIARRRNRLPALRRGHADLVAALDRALPGTGLAVTGNYFLGVSIEDCLTRSASEFRRLFAS
jgi:protoporphyrinogen oxidase